VLALIAKSGAFGSSTPLLSFSMDTSAHQIENTNDLTRHPSTHISLQTPDSRPIGLGLNPPTQLPNPDDSYQPYWNASGPTEPSGQVDDDDEEAEGEENDGEDDDEEGAAGSEDERMSETSSAMFDPEADPEGYAMRLDELAGVLELSEKEEQALRWAPTKGAEQCEMLQLRK
jgi:hypothetical protein